MSILLQGGNEPVKRILIRGEAMSGKTTFLRKICYDWAKLHYKDGLHSPNIDKLKQFHLVLPIILRMVTQTDIFKVIEDQLDFLSNNDISLIKYYLTNKAYCVLWVFDGLDEFNPAKNSDIEKILRQFIYKDSYFIVTSRGEGISNIPKLKSSIQLEVQLVGFGDQEVKQYVDLFYKEKLEYGDQLYNIIMKSKCRYEIEEYEGYIIRDQKMSAGGLYDMATNPGRLGILCLLWNEKKQVSSDRNTLFWEFVSVLLNLAEERRGDEISENPIDYHKDVLVKFGRLGNTRIVNNDMKTVFTMREVQDKVGSDVMTYGFLYKSHPVNRLDKCEVSFIHKNVQEWLVAFAISNSDEDIEYESIHQMNSDISMNAFLLSMNAFKMKSIVRRTIAWWFNGQGVWDPANEDVLELLNWQYHTRADVTILDELSDTDLIKTIFQSDILYLNGEHYTGSFRHVEHGLGYLLTSVFSKIEEWVLHHCFMSLEGLIRIIKESGQEKIKVSLQFI